MTMGDLATVPLDGAHRRSGLGMARRSRTEMQATADKQVRRLPQPEGKRVDDACQEPVQHGLGMLDVESAGAGESHRRV